MHQFFYILIFLFSTLLNAGWSYAQGTNAIAPVPAENSIEKSDQPARSSTHSSDTETATDKVNRVTTKTGQTIKQTAEKTGNAVKKAAKKTGHAIEGGVRKVKKGTRKAAAWTEEKARGAKELLEDDNNEQRK